MATYAIGDIQGCYLTLKALLKQIHFIPKQDHLWLLGDLINRGPRSLEVMEWYQDHVSCAHGVLGNHEVFFLALSEGLFQDKIRAPLIPLLESTHLEQYRTLILQFPLVHAKPPWVMVHAGIPPAYSLKEALKQNQIIQNTLQNNLTRKNFLEHSFKRPIPQIASAENDWDKQVAWLQALTRMRACKSPQVLDFEYNGVLSHLPPYLKPWFEYRKENLEERILFGHWAALGLKITPGFIGLDMGCAWGKYLCAYRLEDGATFVERYQE